MSANLSMGTDVQLLWDLESLGVRDKDKLSIRDKCLTKQFENDLNFLHDFQEIWLLWKISPAELKSNFTLTKNWFDNLQKCFDKNKWIANK